MPETVPFPADITERAIAKIQAKRQRTELRNQIIAGTAEYIRLLDRNTDIYMALAVKGYTNHVQMQEMTRELSQNLKASNVKVDGLKLLLAELSKLEASNA